LPRNLRSSAAILKLGAVEQIPEQEERIRPDGTQRISRLFRLFPPRQGMGRMLSGRQPRPVPEDMLRWPPRSRTSSCPPAYGPD